MVVKHLALIVAMLFIPVLAKADSVWTYQGNSSGQEQSSTGEGYTLDGTVLLNNADQVTGWNFAGGPTIFTNQNSYGTFVLAANFSTWDINLFLASDGGPIHLGGYLESSNAFDRVSDHDGSAGQVYVVGNPGVWKEVISTPEPGALLLLGAGMAALGTLILLKPSLSTNTCI